MPPGEAARGFTEEGSCFEATVDGRGNPALLLARAVTAFADDTLPGADTALVEVYVPSEADVDKLVADVRPRGVQARRGRRHDLLNIDADPRARGAASAAGYKIGATIEDATSTAPRSTRSARRPRRRSARRRPRRGRPAAGGAKLEGKSVVPPPGETVIQRANKFTNYAGTFLYVEAHNKATVRVTRQHRLHRPDAGALVRRCRRRLRRGHQHGPLHRHRPDARRVPVPPPARPAARPRRPPSRPPR